MFGRSKAGSTTPLALQYMSDLHLERLKYDFTISKAAPILVLAGDIGRVSDGDAYRAFLAQQCEQFEMVLLVAGNHEFYGCTREEGGLRVAQSFVKDPSMCGRLHFLNRTRIDVPQTRTTILACTLQSYIAPGYTKLTNDFQRIKEWRVKDHNEEHQRDLAWLKSSLADLSQAPDRRIIVVTHYAPAFEKTCHPLNENNAVSQCFSSDALQQILALPGMKSISQWIFGHTHWNSKFSSGGIVVMSNQLCNDSQRLTWWQQKILYRPFSPEATIHL